MRGTRFTLNELVESNEEIPEGLLAGHMLLPGTISALAGQDGSGKTWMIAKLAVAVATGGRFGPMKTKKARVLIISEEMTSWEFKQRMKMLISDEERAEAGDNLIFRFKTGLDLRNFQDRKELADLIVHDMPELVIVDCLRDVHGGKESDNDELVVWLTRLRDRIAVPYKCCILFSHHFRKTAEGSEDDWIIGGNVIRRISSEIFYLIKDQDVPGSGVFKTNKVRHGRPHPPFPYSIVPIEELGRVAIDFLPA